MFSPVKVALKASRFGRYWEIMIDLRRISGEDKEFCLNEEDKVWILMT